MGKVKEEVSSLRHANEELEDQVERLQKNRFNMVQELVYQRWIHTCLRFEIQNHQNQSRKTLKCDDSRKDSTQKPHEKTNPLSSDPGFHNISSNTSPAESDEIDSTTFDSSSSSQISKKTQVEASTKSLETLTFRRARRVSFNDSVRSVESTYLDEPSSATLPMDSHVLHIVAALFFFFMLLVFLLYLSATKYSA